MIPKSHYGFYAFVSIMISLPLANSLGHSKDLSPGSEHERPDRRQESGHSSIVVSEIHYHPEDTQDCGNWFEILNAGPDSVDLSGWSISDSNPAHIYYIQFGLLIGPGNRWVFVNDSARFRQVYPEVKNYSGQLAFGLGNHADEIYLYDPLHNMEVYVAYSDSLPWPPGPDGLGYTLELRDPYADLNDPANWSEGCLGGSPGTARSICNEPVIFSEINYNSSDLFKTGEWVELRNISDEAIDIGGWSFMDDSTGTGHVFQLPQSLELESHSNWVLAGNTENFTSAFPDVKNFSGPFPFRLDNAGEWIRMYDASGTLRISMQYNDRAPWPVEADGQGFTMEIIDSLANPNDGSNWKSFCMGGTPGLFLTDECPDYPQFIDEVMITLMPNPMTDLSRIRVYAVRDLDLTFRLLSSQGVFLKYIYAGNFPDGISYADLNMAGMAGGLYLLEVVGPDVHMSSKVIKR